MLSSDWTSAVNRALLLLLKDAKLASEDLTPRVARLGGVEVVRRIVSPTSEVRMAKFKAKSSSRVSSLKNRGSSTLRAKKGAPRAASSHGGATKHARVLGMLRSKGGARIAAIVHATGWQPHSVRGFLAGVVKRKLGLNLTSEKTNSGRVYRIATAKHPHSDRSQTAAEPAHA